jgi:hypothetical protein
MLIINHDNNSEILSDIRKATTIEKIHELATKKGIVASHTLDFNWISLALTPLGEDIFIARKCEEIEFKGINYPVRTFDVIIEGDEQTITIGTLSLFDAMDEMTDVEESNALDNQIYFYVEDELIGLDGEEICKNHLDDEMEFIEEIFE